MGGAWRVGGGDVGGKTARATRVGAPELARGTSAGDGGVAGLALWAGRGEVEVDGARFLLCLGKELLGMAVNLDTAVRANVTCIKCGNGAIDLCTNRERRLLGGWAHGRSNLSHISTVQSVLAMERQSRRNLSRPSTKSLCFAGLHRSRGFLTIFCMPALACVAHWREWQAEPGLPWRHMALRQFSYLPSLTRSSRDPGSHTKHVNLSFLF